MVACQAPPSMEFSRQEYWSGLPCPPPGDLPDSGIESTSLTSPALVGSLPLSATRESEKQVIQLCLAVYCVWLYRLYIYRLYTLCDPIQSTGLQRVYSLYIYSVYSLRNSPGQNTGVVSLSLLQRIFPTQGSNPGLPHCRWILYQLSHKGNPNVLLFSSNSGVTQDLFIGWRVFTLASRSPD